MTKKIINIVGIFSGVVILIAAGLYCYLALERNLKLSCEQEVFTERTTYGMFWDIITSEDVRSHLMKKWKVALPQNDFSKNYLLVSDGRKIKKLSYRLISRYQWHYPFPMGVEVFDKTHYTHSMFVYRIKKIFLHQDSD